MGMSKQGISNVLLRMKDGEMPKLVTLLVLQKHLGENIIFFNF